MFTLLIAAAICSQNVQTQSVNNELAFTYQMEEFVYKYSESKKLPPKIERIFILLGDTDFRKREKTSILLEQYCKDHPDEVRWLFWGRHNSDLEVAVRCNVVLKSLYKCTQCKGGIIQQGSFSWDCMECLGRGTLWGMTAWD